MKAGQPPAGVLTGSGAPYPSDAKRTRSGKGLEGQDHHPASIWSQKKMQIRRPTACKSDPILGKGGLRDGEKVAFGDGQTWVRIPAVPL